MSVTGAADWVPEIVDRLREFEPVKIILFGSRARGDAGEHSDFDLLVVMPQVDGRRELQLEMRRRLSDFPIAKDVWVTDPEEIARTGDKIGSFLHPVLREGRVIYGVDERDEHVWLRYAEEDLEAADRITSGRGWAPRIVCFLAQQAAEKALKAVLVANQIPLQFTHNLTLLRDLAPAGSRVHDVDVDLERLSRWAIVSRYPGAEPDATDDEAREALTAAHALVEAAREDMA